MTTTRGLALQITTAWVALFLVTIAPCRGQSRDLGRMVTWMYQDPGALGRQADRRTVLYAASGLAAVGTLSLLDQTLAHEIEEGYRGPFKTYTDLTNRLGDPIVAAPVVGLFGLSLMTRNRRFQDAAFTSLQSFLYAGLTTIVLKEIVGRYRPAGSDTPYRFAPFSGRTSFPSGHVTAATAILVPWAMYYPHPVTWVAVAAAVGGTAMARIARTKHWASDVVAGGAIGGAFGYSLARLHQHPAMPARLSAHIGVRRIAVTVRL